MVSQLHDLGQTLYPLPRPRFLDSQQWDKNVEPPHGVNYLNTWKGVDTICAN